MQFPRYHMVEFSTTMGERMIFKLGLQRKGGQWLKLLSLLVGTKQNKTKKWGYLNNSEDFRITK